MGVESWSVDCVAQWLENLGFPDLKTPFMGNKVDGASLKDITMDKLGEDYGVSDEDQRKKIYGSLKDVVKKDSYSGNTNYYSQMLMWILPFAAIYLWLSLKYEKQTATRAQGQRRWHERVDLWDQHRPQRAEEAQGEEGSKGEAAQGEDREGCVRQPRPVERSSVFL